MSGVVRCLSVCLLHGVLSRNNRAYRQAISTGLHKDSDLRKPNVEHIFKGSPHRGIK